MKVRVSPIPVLSKEPPDALDPRSQRETDNRLPVDVQDVKWTPRGGTTGDGTVKCCIVEGRSLGRPLGLTQMIVPPQNTCHRSSVLTVGWGKRHKIPDLLSGLRTDVSSPDGFDQTSKTPSTSKILFSDCTPENRLSKKPPRSFLVTPPSTVDGPTSVIGLDELRSHNFGLEQCVLTTNLSVSEKNLKETI